MNPFVRHMLICDDVRSRPDNVRKVDVYGLLSTVRPGQQAFPVQLTFCVYVAMTGGRGTGTVQVVVADAETGEANFTGAAHPITFDPDPLKVLGAIFRIRRCPFPHPGLYWVEFRYNGETLARQPLQVREEP
jgi:hypothetical protein